MSLNTELDYDGNDISKVKNCQFSILSPEEIINRSVAEIVTQETYENDIPKIGGLFDARMGVLDFGKLCPTDNLDSKFCPGYFGHIKLAMPVFYVHFINYIIKILKCVCYRCSNCLLNEDEIKKLPKKPYNRFVYVLNLCTKKVRVCTECGANQPNNIKRDTQSICKLSVEWKNKDDISRKENWNAENVLDIFKYIPDDVIEILGFNTKWCKPEWLICSVLPVAPPTVRPSVRNESNTRMEDDLTHKYCDIIKTNRALKQKITSNSSSKIINEWEQLLQYHIATLIDNQIPGIPPAQQRSGRPLKSIKERLRSKEGRVRGNLMGKRVDFSARSVITPDPNIEIDQLGVPIKVARNLTFPEIVTKFNIKTLTEYVRNGYDKWPGAKSYKRKVDNQIISLKHIDTKKINLVEGDIVNRHLIDDDVVLFNRQPSLHRMSMMAHRVVVMNYNTFRLNVCVTKPYNADFDGDEMNMHVPQSYQSKVELKLLASVLTQVITPAQNQPIISFVQDSLLGLYQFTKLNNFYTKKEVDDITLSIKPLKNIENPIIKKGSKKVDIKNKYDNFPFYKYDIENNDYWDGKQIFSIIIPDSINYKTDKFLIENGILKKGILDKSIMGSKQQGLIHIIYNDLGIKECEKFLNNVHNLITRFMLLYGYSIGIGDLVANNKTSHQMSESIKNRKKEVIEIIENIHNNTFVNDSSKNNNTEFEFQINGLLNKAVGDAVNTGIKELPNNNRLLNIIESGSKGTPLNIGQMIACVGQQNVDGKRIPYGFTDRTLPHFHKYDDGPGSRGFVEHSFIDGLSPHEFFFHAMGGREGVIDTAVKTAETGYIQRKLIKSMEDLIVHNDNTVRNSNNHIIQYLYGEDGINPLYVEKCSIPTLKMNNKTLYYNYKFEYNTLWDDILNSDILMDFNKLDYSLVMNKLDEHLLEIIDDRRYIINKIFKNDLNDTTINFPINMNRLIKNSQYKFPNYDKKSNLNPIYILEKIDEIRNICKINNINNANQMLNIFVRAYFSPKKIIIHDKLNNNSFNYCIEYIKNRFFTSIEECGTLVGTIAAQSIGEPSTQMTLNTFHFAGVSAKSEVVRGVPRLKELISVSKNIKSPMVTIALNNEYSNDKNKALDLLNTIEITYIKDITLSTSIYYDPLSTLNESSFNTEINDDKELFKFYDKYKNIFDECEDTTNPWILRFEFDRSKMIQKNIKMIDIYQAINNKFNDDSNDSIKCIFSDDNSSKLIFRVQFIDNDDYKSDDDNIISVIKIMENTILNNIILKGISNINKATLDANKYMYYENEKNEFINREIWTISTNGTNLIDIFNLPNIDFENTISNDIVEIYNLLGIEAAREALINEITELISFDGTYINYRHIALLADTITNKGNLMSIDRHGINKSDIGPLGKCSFEETPDVLIKAAIFGELDNCNGVSANIMMGQEVKCGTGFTDILFDEDLFIDSINKIIPNTNVIEQSEELDDKTLDNYCNNINSAFSINNINNIENNEENVFENDDDDIIIE